VIDSLSSFRRSADIYYLSIWECYTGRKTVVEINNLCKIYTTKKISFDYSFTLDNADELYCSEFCSTILNSVHPRKFDFKPTAISLDNELYEAILKRKILIYYPVDFFETNQKFKKIYEWKSVR
jgi:hypothetical protein